MSTPMLDQVVNAVLYEGHLLYPYRASAKKNRQRFTFGRVYPEAFSRAENGAEPCVMQTECLFQCLSEAPSIEVEAGFLHPLERQVGLITPAHQEWLDGVEPRFKVVAELEVDGNLFQTWQEAVERKIKLPLLSIRTSSRMDLPFQFPASRAWEPIHDSAGRVVGVILRRQCALEGVVELEVRPVDAHIFKITTRIRNQAPIAQPELNAQNEVLLRTFASTHTVLRAHGGEWLSLMDPPATCRQAAADCDNIGAWPVLVGDAEKGERDIMLSSPIILSDYPQIAPESPGNFFDGTEIDEMLTLRILTMTDGEKLEMRQVDEHARRLLDRTEGLRDEDRLKLRGRMRVERSFEEEVFGAGTQLQGVSVDDVFLQKGDRVRIRPKARADVMDLALAGKTAVIEGVEQDAESRIHLALVLQDDPGRDLGLLRQPGHRFFYGPDEVEPLRKGL